LRHHVVVIVANQVNVARELRRALGRPAARKVLPLIVPAVMLVEDRAGTSVANPSPRLPNGARWPHWQGQAMVLLLDIDLAAVDQVVVDPLLPAGGRLLVFADGGRDHPIVPDAGSGVLLHVRPGASTRPVEPPPDTVDLGSAVHLAAHPGWSLPDLERRVRHALAEDYDAIWAYYKFYHAMSVDHQLRWAQVFGEVDDQDGIAAAVSKEAALDWPDWLPSEPSHWRPALTVATELCDNVEITYWLCTDVALPERLDRPSLYIQGG
jgi:Domain of unknown function (DUF1963)